MSTVVDTASEQALQVAGPLQLPPRTHAELHDELHARPPLRTFSTNIAPKPMLSRACER